MSWLANNWRSVLWFLLVAAVVTFGTAASHYHARMLQAQEKVSAALQARKKAESIASNLITAVTLFNDIGKAAHDARYQNETESERRIVYIRQSIQRDACAAHPVPADAADSLRKHNERIRSAPGSAHSGRTAG